MKNKEFIQACVNHYKLCIKQKDVPGIHLTKTGRLSVRPMNIQSYNIIRYKGKVNTISGNNDNWTNYINEFHTLMRINRKEIKKIFTDNNFFFTTAFNMYGEAFYNKFK
jgi:hypothetical protein